VGCAWNVGRTNLIEWSFSKIDAVSVPYPWTTPPCTVPESEPVGSGYCSRHDGGYALRQLLSVPRLFLHGSTVFHADPGGSLPRGPLGHYYEVAKLIKPISNCKVGNIGSWDEYFRATSELLSMEYAQLRCAIIRTFFNYHRVLILRSTNKNYVATYHISQSMNPSRAFIIYISTTSLNYQTDI
jgi:hypothetical protein